MSRTAALSLVAALLPAALLLGGCVGGSPPTRFYALEAEPVAAPLAVRPDLALGLGPVTLPESLDRPQILIRPEPYRRDLAEFDRWAGDLKADLVRALGTRLGELLGSDRVSPYPWPRSRRLDLQVQVDVLQLDGRPGGDARLRGTFVLMDGEGGRELQLVPFALQRPVPGNDYRDLVAALSGLTAELADRIAQAVTRQAPAAPPAKAAERPR